MYLLKQLFDIEYKHWYLRQYKRSVYQTTKQQNRVWILLNSKALVLGIKIEYEIVLFLFNRFDAKHNTHNLKIEMGNVTLERHA